MEAASLSVCVTHGDMGAAGAGMERGRAAGGADSGGFIDGAVFDDAAFCLATS